MAASSGWRTIGTCRTRVHAAPRHALWPHRPPSAVPLACCARTRLLAAQQREGEGGEGEEEEEEEEDKGGGQRRRRQTARTSAGSRSRGRSAFREAHGAGIPALPGRLGPAVRGDRQLAQDRSALRLCGDSKRPQHPTRT
ncbi:unnamed protein product [Prorocentrum cordatum]|uniref:Uncharacterized protein n=1 Tax=Prorocentrum cordatum TaxID=2364126 RepID=A0ABN9UG23_9DINO|nr:unnamed protein product [Polarella glacialis]